MRPARDSRTLILIPAVVLALAVYAPVCAHAQFEVDITPAMSLTPESPIAGAALVVELADDLLASDRDLQLRDADRDRIIATQQLGHSGVLRFRFMVPVDTDHVVVALVQGETLILRWPATGALAVLAADPAPTGAATMEVGLEGSAETRPCTQLPPPEDAGRENLLAWLATCALDHVSLAGRDLRGVDLAGRDLRRADLRGTNLADARLSGAVLVDANLLGANLDGTDLSGADLQIADLGHTSMFVTDLAGANLRGADLRQAVLTNANLANADLFEARLRGATFDACDFSGAICPDGTRTRSRCDPAHLLP